MSDSVRHHRWQPIRLPHSWDSPGKNTGVGCHCLLQCMKLKSEKWKWSRSVMSDSSRPHGLQPRRLLHPRDFPGKSTGVGCHCLLHSLEGLMLKLQYFGHLTRRADSLEKILMLSKIEGKGRRGWQRTRSLDNITDSIDMSLSKL